jgi:uncharacterized membrane protein YeaQ/YmgE (transglycosylase-associated protein family)
MDIIILILVGALSGWIANKVFGLEASPLVYILLGVVGGMVGAEVFGLLNVSFGSGIVRDIITGTAGAFLLVLAYRLVNRKEK